MNRLTLISGAFAMCFSVVFGCASADDASVNDDATSRGLVESEDIAADEGDIGSAAQAITLPYEEPAGPSVQCVAACQRYSSTNISGHCCVCNGAVETFARHPAIANLYLCR